MPATSVIRNGSSLSSSSATDVRVASGWSAATAIRISSSQIGRYSTPVRRLAGESAESTITATSTRPASSASSALSSSCDLQRELGVGAPRAQIARRARQQPGGGRRERGHAHLRAADAGGVAHGLLRAPGRVQQRGRVPHEHLSRRRQGHAAGVALEHAHPEGGLQAGDVLGDGGLREVQRDGGVGERAAHGDLTEGGEQLEVEHHGPLCHNQQLIIGHDRCAAAPSSP